MSEEERLIRNLMGEVEEIKKDVKTLLKRVPMTEEEKRREEEYERKRQERKAEREKEEEE